MLQGKKFISVLTAVTVCTVFTAGFTTQAASSMPEAYTISSVDKGESAELIEKIPAMELLKAQQAAKGAKAEYDAEQLRIKKEQERIAEEQRKAAEEAQRAAEEAKRAAEEEAARAAEEAQAAEALSQAAPGEQELLASIIFCEAGNQPYEGQVAVGAVIMNRVRSGVYPNSISEVIYQSGQFGPAMTGWLDSVLASGGYTDTAMQAAADALAGSNPVGDCLYFGNGDWGIQIGDHFFH